MNGKCVLKDDIVALVLAVVSVDGVMKDGIERAE